MAKTRSGSAGSPVKAAEAIAAKTAAEMALEFCEVTFQKEPRGKCLCVYLDKPGGITLDDCEKYHKRVQPLLESIDYDFLEVSSPGIDRPIKTRRDFEKNRGALVEVRLFAPQDGAKTHTGALIGMDDDYFTIECAGQEKRFAKKSVALVKPVIEFEDE